VKRISRIAPGATQIAAGEAHEDTWKSRARSFALNGFENLGDEHL
jgi:hypothetical protein